MKKFLIYLICFGFLLSGCSKEIKDTEIQPTETVPTTTIAVTEVTEITEIVEENDTVTELYAVSVPAITQQTIHNDGTELFSFTAQHIQLILPDADVAEKVELDFLNRVDIARLAADSVLTSAQNSYTDNSNWYPYSYQILYSPTRIDHGVLSMFGIQTSYSGGMHANKNCLSVNYDLMTGDILTLGSIMHAEATTDDFIDLVLEKLQANKVSYNLYNDYESGVINRLGGDENLYEDFFFTPTGLNFYFSPYEIAPYSSGVITVEIPYNELPGLIYDGYFPAEREQFSGSMCTDVFDISNSSRFNNMAEIHLANGAGSYVVYPEGTVENIRVTMSGDNRTMPEYTVFAAFEMSDRDAIIINLEEEMIGRVTIHYATNQSTSEITLHN